MNRAMENKVSHLKRQYTILTGNGHTHNEASAALHKLNACSAPVLTRQDVDDLCHMGYYHFDQRTSEIANGLD